MYREKEGSEISTAENSRMRRWCKKEHQDSVMLVLLGTTGSQVITTGMSVRSTQIRVRLIPIVLLLRVAASIFLHLITQQIQQHLYKQ